jgi:hypothetical protein
MDTRRFFVLAEPCPAKEVESMMGRVVLDHRQPLKNYAPVEPFDASEERHNPQDIVPTILEDPVVTLSRRELLGKIQSHAIRTKLTQYFGIDLARSKEDQVEFESRLVRKYSLRQVQHHFNKLMQYQLYARDVAELMKERGKAYMVTGFMTTEGASWTKASKIEQSVGFDITLPISQIAGVPGIDVGVAPSSSRGGFRQQSYTTDATEIFAIAYDVIKNHRRLDRAAPNFMSVQPALGGAKRVQAHHLALGPEDENDEVPENSEDEDEDREEDLLKQSILWSGQLESDPI